MKVVPLLRERLLVSIGSPGVCPSEGRRKKSAKRSEARLDEAGAKGPTWGVRYAGILPGLVQSV